jgi:hypothetical protein
VLKFWLNTWGLKFKPQYLQKITNDLDKSKDRSHVLHKKEILLD